MNWLKYMLVFVLISSAQATTGTLLVITTSWCPSCKKFEKEVGQMYNKTDEAKQLQMIRVSKEELEDRYFLTAYMVPTFIIIDSAENEINRFRGYHSSETFWMNIGNALGALKKQ